MSAEDYLKAGNEFYNKGEYDQAISDFTKAIELKPDYALAYCNRGNSRDEKGEYDQAIADYTKAIELNPDYAGAYNNRGISWKNKGEYDKAIADYTEAIALKPIYAEAYNNRGISLNGKGEYDQAIADYTKAIELKPNYEDAYNNRGISWRKKGEYDQAIADYTKAIELNPNYPEAYYNRGNSFYNKGEYDQAIADYTKAIQLNPDHADTYNNRGLSWNNKEEYDQAIADYTKAIELKPDHAFAYNNRGISLDDKGEYDQAIADYTKALELDPDADAYNNRGYAWFQKGDYVNAIEDYDKALGIDPSRENTKYWRDQAKLKLGEKILATSGKPDKPLYLFSKLLDGIADDEVPESERTELLKKANNIVVQVVNKIRKHASENVGALAAHYTKLKVIDLIVGNETKEEEKVSRLRYYNAVYMNDPEEGKIILDCFDDDKIREAFENGKRNEENNIYLGSFLPDDHKDDLVMWRTYGKDENRNEAVGCSLVINTKFFDGNRSSLNPELSRGESKVDGNAKNDVVAESLYRVLYFDKRKGKYITEDGKNAQELQTDMDELRRALKEILNMKKKGESKWNSVINKIVYHILSEVRYFFKSADYAFENELRVIQFATFNNPAIKFDAVTLPQKMYIESVKPIQPYIKQIYLGPKVPHPEQWMYLEVMMKRRGYKMEVNSSTCKFQ